MPSFLVKTLGCKVNQLESEAITDAFVKAGFENWGVGSREWGVGKEAAPSVIIVNTCTVTSKADQKARRVIRKALRDYPDSYVLVTGCYARLNKEELSKLDEGEQRLFVLNGSGKISILELPNYLYKQNDYHKALKQIFANPASLLTPHSSPNRNFELIDDASLFNFHFSLFSENSAHTRSFLKIQDGCDKQCTYCKIRLARGKSVSLDADEVLSRLKILEKNHNEAVLTGVNISQYSFEDKNLASLLDYLLSGTEKIALRLSSLAPDSVDETLAKVISGKRIRPHFHLSIQSGSKKILEKMGRSYDAQTIEKAVSFLRHAKNDPFLACDIITGFPGETELEFKETLSLCRKLDFAWIHVFPYSKRPGTPAWSFQETVQENEVNKRVQTFTGLAWKGRADYVCRWLGREVEVLVEKSGLKSGCRGVTENYLKALVRYEAENAPPPGSLLRCRLLKAEGVVEDFDVVAEEIKNS